jgi:hypothetical protein
MGFIRLSIGTVNWECINLKALTLLHSVSNVFDV